MYKIAIFSDIHSNLEALESIMIDINKNNYDEVICLGDVLAIGPNPRECLDLIIENNVQMLLGNHELYYVNGTDIDDEMSELEKEHQRWVASNLDATHREYLKKCKETYSLDIENYSVGFEHFLIDKSSNDGYPFYSIAVLHNGTINELLKVETYNLLFIGHEHKPFEINMDNKRIIDVGSSGCRKNNTTYYTVFTIIDGDYSVERKELIYDRSKFESKMKDANYPEKKFVAKVFFGINE